MTGVVLPFWLDRPPMEALGVAEVAMALGYEELWVGELYHFDAFALAGRLAAAPGSTTLTVGPLAVGVRDPLSLARGLASVSTLGGRPARLALGASNPTIVSRFHGRDFAEPARRMEETVEAVRETLASGRSPQGYRSALDAMPVHVSVAAAGPRLLDVADRVADRSVGNLVTVPQAGRAAAAVRCPTVVWAVVAHEPGPATLRQVASQVAHYLGAPGYREMFAEAGFADLVARADDRVPPADLAVEVPWALIEAVALVGSRHVIGERISAYREVGADLALVPATADDPAGERTLAAVRDLVG